MAKILGFENEFKFMSNFVPARVELDGVFYPTTEHAYQAAKTLDPEQRHLIKLAVSPGVAKRLGGKLACRSDWAEVKDAVMFDLLLQKFSKPEYVEQLLATGDAYIEETNSWHDTYWGVCNGEGQNKLGNMLMEIRELLKEINAHSN